MQITITTDIIKLSGKLTNLAAKQIPFATQEAVNRLAFAAQGQVKADLDKHFTIRRPWVGKRINVNKAHKSTWPFVSAEVGTQDEFMARQELGGTKSGMNGGRVAIPKAARPNPKVTTPQRAWPGKLRSSKRRKFFTITSNQGNTLIMQRFGRGRGDIKTFYMLTRSVKVQKRWNFVQTIEARVAGNWDREFGRALAYAIATAR